MFHRNFNHRRGFSLIELTLALGLFVLLLSGVTAPLIGSYLKNAETAQKAQAYDFLIDGWEALRVARAGNFASVLSSTESRGIFTRQITVSEVQRDDTGAIVESGTVDPDTKKVILEVTWQNTAGQNRSLSAETRLTNYKNASDWPPAPPTPPAP
jgi:prepilin-type N-terminal cleavage/methylation domain-containing protein